VDVEEVGLATTNTAVQNTTALTTRSRPIQRTSISSAAATTV
jgi:hypothetical protein